MRVFTRRIGGLTGLLAATALVVGAATPAVAAPAQPAQPHVTVGGYVSDGTKVPLTATAKGTYAADALPASVDLRAYAPAVGDQGNVGSCVAWTIGYSIMGYYANRTATATGAPYAPLYLYLRSVKGAPPDTGLVPEDALTEAKSNGVDTQADYTQGTTNYKVAPTAAEIANAKNYRITSWNTLWAGIANQGTAGQLAIEKALAAGKPVAIGFPVFKDFMSLKSGTVYSTTSGASLGGHMVTAFGYDSQGLWIRNQWTTAWGTKGDAKLSWAFVNKLVMAAYTVDGITTPAKSTTPPATPVTTVKAPVVSKVNPASVATTGGTTVTVTGTGFTGATTVRVGDVAASGLKVLSDTALTFVAPKASGAGTAHVRVVAAGGTSAVVTADALTYVAPKLSTKRATPTKKKATTTRR